MRPSEWINFVLNWRPSVRNYQWEGCGMWWGLKKKTEVLTNKGVTTTVAKQIIIIIKSFPRNENNEDKFLTVTGNLTLWHLTSGIPIVQWDAQNTQHQVKVMTFNGLLYATLIQILIFCSSHSALTFWHQSFTFKF